MKVLPILVCLMLFLAHAAESTEPADKGYTLTDPVERFDEGEFPQPTPQKQRKYVTLPDRPLIRRGPKGHHY